MNHNSTSHRRLYKIFSVTNTYEDRHEIILDFTAGRTNNSSELSQEEIEQLIYDLETHQRRMGIPLTDFQKGETMRRRVLAMFHQYGFTKYSTLYRKMVVDFERLDAWMIRYSYLHKKLNEYSYSELVKLVSQVEILLKKYLEAV